MFDSRPLHPASSALAHGTLIHTLDYDDTFPVSVIHPLSVVLPAVWSASQDATHGAEVLTAMAAANEFLARLGAAAGRGLHARGFQATSIFGPLAAALAVGTLRGRDPRTTAAAMGLAGSMSGGLLEFLSDGTWSKRLHPGWAAHGGVVADLHAARGFPGPATVVEGRHGLFSSFLESEVEPERLRERLGDEWHSREVELKLYPCAHVLHPFIAMASELALSTGAVGEIDEIVCGVAPWYVPIVCEPREEKLAPTSEYQARTSLPLAVALALVDGDVHTDSFDLESVRRPAVRSLAERVTVVEQPELDAGFGAQIELRHRDGRRQAGRPQVTDVAARAQLKFQRAFSSDDVPAQAAHGLWEAATAFDSQDWGRVREAAASVSPLVVRAGS